MAFIGGEVAVRQVSDERWELLEPLVYQGRKDTITVPKGFRTDFASVPHFFTWLVPRYGRYTRAAVLHDFLCVEAHARRFSRYDADGIFRRVMRELGVGFLRRWVMWIAVRFGSGLPGLFERGASRAVPVLVLGILAGLILSIPALVIALWLVLFWVLEWVVLPVLRARRGRKSVNPPRGILGT